jgi:hypothetical protein
MSSPPLKAISNGQESYNSNCYRTEKVADGNIVRVFDTPRRGHRATGQSTPAVIRRSATPTQDVRQKKKAGLHQCAIKPDVVVLRGISSDTSTPSTQTSHRSDEDVRGGCNEASQTTPQKVFSIFFDSFGLPSPPPTPKLNRLPTPDLEPLEQRSFCDCCGRYPGQTSHQVEDAARLSME